MAFSLIHSITDALFSLETALRKENKGPITTASVESVRKNAAALQMGLMEAKVGGIQLSDDLDKSYKEWAELELRLRMLPLKQVLESKNPEQKTNS